MPALCTSTSGAAAATETVSSRLPTASTTLMTGAAATCRTMPVCDKRAEPLGSRFKPVRAGRQVRQHVGAALVGDDGARKPRIRLSGGDGDAGKHGTAFVGDAAAQLRGGELCPCPGRGE